MDWDQIESKWVAMTRRVRADLPFAQSDAKVKVLRRTIRGEGSAPIVVDRPNGIDTGGRSAIHTK